MATLPSAGFVRRTAHQEPVLHSRATRVRVIQYKMILKGGSVSNTR